MKKALVTGGAGFIGSHLAGRLIREGWSVSIIDNLSTGFKENVPVGAEFTLLDISKEDFIDKLSKVKYDAVFHLAAQSSGEISFDDPLYDLNTNCRSTVALLDWCLKNGIKRFVYTSSMSIYGDQDLQPVREDAKPRPKSFYGVGKMASEDYVNIYSKIGINTTSLRLFNVYGPGQNMANMRQGMVSIYMAQIAKGEEVLVKGSGDRYRDLIYIDDVIDAYMSCIDNQKTFGNVYNVGTGIKTTVKDLLRAELIAFGQDPSRYPVTFSGSTAGDTFGIFADIKAIRNDFRWEPKVSLGDGLGRMARWVLASNKKELYGDKKKSAGSCS